MPNWLMVVVAAFIAYSLFRTIVNTGKLIFIVGGIAAIVYILQFYVVV